jgi:diaminopimelate epimerase
MIISFTKMQALGNDFVIVNNMNHTLTVSTVLINHLCDRHFGIGCDQLLLLEPSSNADFHCRIFNADGGEVEQCGNGLRCLARYIEKRDLCSLEQFTISTGAGVFTARVLKQEIEITLGVPQVDVIDHVVVFADGNLRASLISMGNPHAIIQVEELANYPIKEIGQAIEALPYFSTGINVGFVRVIDRGAIELRTYERGVGETLSCGSNACAAVVAGMSLGLLDNEVSVQFRFGQVNVIWCGRGSDIKLRGEAHSVYEGKIAIIPPEPRPVRARVDKTSS